MCAHTMTINGDGGDEVQAYLAEPDVGDSRGGVVVIHHMPGYDRATKEIVRRFAELGYDAVCPNLYWREAPGADPDDAAATVRGRPAACRTTRLVGDVGGAAALPAAPADVQRQGRRDRLLLGRPADPCSPPAISTSTPPSTATARSSPARRRGLPAEGHQSRRPAAATCAPAARPVRQGGQVPEPRAGRRARRDPHRARQGVRVPPLRRRRPRVLRGRPAVVPGRPPPTTAGSGSPPSSPSTSEAPKPREKLRCAPTPP